MSRTPRAACQTPGLPGPEGHQCSAPRLSRNRLGGQSGPMRLDNLGEGKQSLLTFIAVGPSGEVINAPGSGPWRAVRRSR
jgi:hypothetical protein